MYNGKIIIKSGSIVLPTLGTSAKANGYKFQITKEEYLKDDIQNALRKGYISFDQKAPKIKYTHIKNVSNGTIILQSYGTLKKGKVVRVDAKLNNQIKKLLAEKKLIKSKKQDEDEESPVSQKMSAVVHKPKSDLHEELSDRKNSTKSKGKSIRKIGDNSLILENGEVPGEHDGITFVDIT